MGEVEVAGLTHRYGRVTALSEVTFEVPAGALYALLGPNGAGKTTLLQVLAGLRRPTAGRAAVLGRDVGSLRTSDRALLGYVAEGQKLPGWMTLRELERWLEPLYPTWDRPLADHLRERFRLDPTRRLRTLSRGETMKAALLSTLAARPRLLLMDEPFSGMDAVVKDELVGGLLETASEHGCTVLISSHDLAELEMLADWVGFLDGGRLRLSAPAESLRARFHRVELLAGPGSSAPELPTSLPGRALSVARAGPRLAFVLEQTEPLAAGELLRRLSATGPVEVRPATLREIFVALATAGRPDAAHEVAA